MPLATCRPPSLGVLKKVAPGAQTTVETFERINQTLCLQFDVALAVKEGVRRELVKRTEFDIREALHEDIARMYGAESSRTRPSNCDVCGLIEMAKKLARSQYAKDCKRFMLSTLDAPKERTGFQWGSALDNYCQEARLPDGSGIARRAERAKTVMAALADMAAKTPFAPAAKHHDDDYDGPTIEQMVARSERYLDTLRGKHLKVMR